MTTKYTDEQIIEYLRTLREGDELTAVKDYHGDFSEGRQYTVKEDGDGDLYIDDNDVYGSYVFVGTDYDCSVLRRFVDGTFEIPSQSNAPFYASIRQIVEIESGGKPYKSVTIRVDDAGFAELEALESRSFDSRLLADLYAKRNEIQAEIDALEAV